MIEKAVADEEQTGHLAGAVERVARQNGVHPDQQAIQGVVAFIREYIEYVPQYLEQGSAAAQQLGLQNEWAQMAGALEAYWFDPNDVIHDHLGLLGVTDDAYASLLLLQSVSDYCQATSARPLLQQNLTAVNQAIRGFIGEPGASVLDQQVAITLTTAGMQRMMGQIVNQGFQFSQPDPVWSNASMDEIVTARLGAIGVVF